MAFEQPELLRGLSPEEAQRVTALGTRIALPSGAELFPLGDTADSLYVVERGRIALTLPMQVRQQEEDVLVEERSPGQSVGWSALIPPHRFTLKATAPLETEVLALPRTALLEYFAAHPERRLRRHANVAEVMGQRLQVFQAMWLREMQRVVELRDAACAGRAVKRAAGAGTGGRAVAAWRRCVRAQRRERQRQAPAAPVQPPRRPRLSASRSSTSRCRRRRSPKASSRARTATPDLKPNRTRRELSKTTPTSC